MTDLRSARQVLADAYDTAGWDQHSEITALCGFVDAQGLVAEFADYVRDRLDEEEELAAERDTDEDDDWDDVT